MCNYKNLVKSEWGYVVRCNSCNHLHVAFGTTVLRLSHDEFLSFVNEAKDKLEEYDSSYSKRVKSIAIETSNRNVGLIYTFEELQRFYTLLVKARDVINKEALFNFCDN